MRLLLLISLIVLASCSTPKPTTLEEARSRFYWAVEKARQRECVPAYVEKAYQDLANMFFGLEYSLPEAERQLEQDRFYGQDEQVLDRFKMGVCNEAHDAI